MDFSIPKKTQDLIARIDKFIDEKITPLQRQDDNERFFDYRRENARTDWDNNGLPRREWEILLSKARRLADEAGFYRFAAPKKYGGQDGTNLEMAMIREHLAKKGLGLFNDLQTEHSVVGNFPVMVMLDEFGNEEQRKMIEPSMRGELRMTFGLTEPDHGSDATHMETRAVPETRNGVEGYLVNGRKMWTTGMHVATHCICFCRHTGKPGDAKGIIALMLPCTDPGIKAEQYLWTFNMPTDHPIVSIKNVWVPKSATLGPPDNGLAVAQAFVHENRIRQAASSLGAAEFCIEEAVAYAAERKPFGKPLAVNQGIQFPLVELATQAEMLRLLIWKTASDMDNMPRQEIVNTIGDKVSMCNYWANRLCTQSADRAMQVHGGWGYSRHRPFEHIYRHHRRYRITEGSEEIQMRKVAGFMFGFQGPKKAAKDCAKAKL